MKSSRTLAVAASLSTLAIGLTYSRGIGGTPAEQQTVQAPKFETDLLWPLPLPRHQLLGSVVGLAVDAQDHVYAVHLTNSFVARTEVGATANPPIGECCMSAKAVLEFDAAGNLVKQWGGEGQWPATSNGLSVDDKGNIWIGGTGGQDAQIFRFTKDGALLGTIGKGAAAPAPAAAPTAADTQYTGVGGRGRAGGGGGRAGGGRGGPALPPNSASTESFGGPAAFAFDTKTGEAFVADGSRNRRVAVVDMTTGTIKRFWGAYGKAPKDSTFANSPTSPAFSSVACVELSSDDLVYVCDRANNRIQVFRKNGEFVKEGAVAPSTKGAGSVWDLTFSRDAQQRYIYVADGQNMKVRILDRQTLAELTNFGDGGRQAGQFLALHSIATDSKGNIITAEASQGKRIQRFLFKGVGAVTKSQGTLRPGK